MFRTQANPMDDAVVKATDENLTSENWEYILDVCDRVGANPAGPQQAVASLIKRLAHRNANVQLYTLELANALSQNCGAPLHRELASKAFTDALLRLAADRNTHAQVKQKVLERMGSWTEEFKNNSELGIMEQAYHRLRLQQPRLMPPSKPVKTEISSEDRRKEEEELQMALALSIKDKDVSSPSVGASSTSEQNHANMQTGIQQGTTAATVSRVRALYDFTPSEAGELAFRKNDIIAVLESVYKDWWKGSLRGQTGIFPLNYVEKLQDPTKEELERDANVEAEVFGEIKNVEKLLALLSVGSEATGRRGEREEEEIGELYQRTLSIRPKLIELIARYSQKKDDFTQLNEKFIKARRDYEALLETSMSQSQYQQQYPIRQRQSMYPQSGQQPSYAVPHQPPLQSYATPGNPQSQGYPSQMNYAPQSPQHLPSQQEPQRFYSPSPLEQVNPQPTYSSPYPQDIPSTGTLLTSPAPFHFIPGGLQAPPPAPNEVRRKPSPQPAHASDPTGELYSTASGFQGQVRPNSIHTLNSGNPQELGTGGYESPIDSRHPYAAAPAIQQHMQQMQPPAQSQVYEYASGLQPEQAAPPQPQHAVPQLPRNDRDGLPSRQRTESFESPSSVYASQAAEQYPSSQASAPAPLSTAPLGTSVSGAPQTYQAYNPNTACQPQTQQQQVLTGNDPGDYYR